LERAAGSPPRTPPESLRTERVLEFGGSRLAQALWEQFGLTALLRQLLAGRRYQFEVVAAIATLVFNRLLAPKSELGIFAWRDRLWWPDFAAAAPKLEHLYRALDALGAIKEPLEEALFQRLQNLFNLEVDVVFYDLTSTYFEGEGPPRAALDWVSRIHAVENRLAGQTIWTLSRPAPPAYEVLKAVGIEALPAALRPEEAPAPD
jgi:hypothetical protein